jgi:hypothetical protein
MLRSVTAERRECAAGGVSVDEDRFAGVVDQHCEVFEFALDRWRTPSAQPSAAEVPLDGRHRLQELLADRGEATAPAGADEHTAADPLKGGG